MLLASGMAHFLRPVVHLNNDSSAFILEEAIPRQFGEWKETAEQPLVVNDPGQVENIQRIYSQTLSRTYQNGKGYRVMLSIAYGTDQRDSMQVHKPEICYPAQGFIVESKTTDKFTTPLGEIPLTRLQTHMGERHEPIIYWVIVGETAVNGGVQKKIAEMNYGLKGKIPDGLIFRISSIDSDVIRANVEFDKFVADLCNAVSADIRKKIFGL